MSTVPARLVRYNHIAYILPRSGRSFENLTYARKIDFISTVGFDNRRKKELFVDADRLSTWLRECGFKVAGCPVLAARIATHSKPVQRTTAAQQGGNT